MDMYRMRGHLFIECTMEAADYDFDMEWEEEGEPDALDALRFMLDSGIIQIMHESTEYLGEVRRSNEDLSLHGHHSD